MKRKRRLQYEIKKAGEDLEKLEEELETFWSSVDSRHWLPRDDGDDDDEGRSQAVSSSLSSSVATIASSNEKKSAKTRKRSSSPSPPVNRKSSRCKVDYYREVPISYTTPKSYVTGMTWSIGDLALIRDAIYKVEDQDSIVFQRFSKLVTKGSAPLSYQFEERDCITRGIEVKDSRKLQVKGWKLEVVVCDETKKEYLKFTKE